MWNCNTCLSFTGVHTGSCKEAAVDAAVLSDAHQCNTEPHSGDTLQDPRLSTLSGALIPSADKS